MGGGNLMVHLKHDLAESAQGTQLSLTTLNDRTGMLEPG